VFAGVLNNTVGASEDTKVVRKVTEVFLHEGFDYITLINDIAIIKVSIKFKYVKQTLHFQSDIYVTKCI
jgi:hypothetical protein